MKLTFWPRSVSLSHYSKVTEMKKIILLSLCSAALVNFHCAFDNDDSEAVPNQKADNVRDLTPVEPQYIVAPDSAKLEYTKTSAELQQVKPGDIVVSDINSTSPVGYLKKVTAVEQKGGKTTIQTEPTTITEAVVSGQAAAEGTLNPAGDNSLLTGAQYNPLNGKIETLTPEPGVTVYGTKQPVNAIPECKSKKWYVEFNKNIQNSGGANAGSVNGCVGLDLKFVLNMKIKMFELKNAEFSVNPSVVTKLNVNVNSATFEISRAQVTLTTFHLQPIVFTIGFVPVVIVPRIAIVLGVDGKINVSLTTSVEYSASAKAGISYANKKWTPIKESSQTYNIVPPVFSGDINAMVYVGPEATFLFYGVVGPTANVYVYAHFNVAWNESLGQIQKWDIWLGIQAGAGFVIEAFGRTLLKINEPALIGYEGLIASSDFGGIAPPGTGRVTGVIAQKITGNYQNTGASYQTVSGDLVSVGKLVGSLAKK